MPTYNFYCDESCHLEKDKTPFMLIAYVSSAYNQVRMHNDNIRKIKLNGVLSPNPVTLFIAN